MPKWRRRSKSLCPSATFPKTLSTTKPSPNRAKWSPGSTHLIRNAVIIDDENDEEGTVGRSSIVKIKNVETGDEVTYRLVGFTQSDPLAGKISDESPVGKALIGKHVGDVIEVEAPRGKVSFEILEVAKKN